MKNPEMRAIVLRRSIMDFELKCETVARNIEKLPPTEIASYDAEDDNGSASEAAEPGKKP